MGQEAEAVLLHCRALCAPLTGNRTRGMSIATGTFCRAHPVGVVALALHGRAGTATA
jgi:hypothetical protein